MVSVVHALPAEAEGHEAFDLAARGLNAAARATLLDAWRWTTELYGERKLGSGEPVLPHARAMAVILAGRDLDLDTRVAALLFDIGGSLTEYRDVVAQRYGQTVVDLVAGLDRLTPLRLLMRDSAADQQTEILRKMLLAMVADIRVVLLRLASRTQTLRWLVDNATPQGEDYARESLEIYAPLANRLGVWQFKWELEDLSLRLLEPETYKRIAKMLDERRVEREKFIAGAIERVRGELKAVGIEAEVIGRPKHIYSIWNKMRRKGVEFSEVYDVRALRVIVETVKDCYTVLGIVHNLWQPIAKEFDDYISNPKGNNYRSLHTAVHCADGRSLEVQIRTWEMHRHSELGVAAHWRYKEGGRSNADLDYNEKIAWLRQLLTWKDEVTESSDWVRHYKEAALDETIYVLTPQGRVLDLPRGATPIDFAYRLHTDVGHRCRGAKVDGHLVPLGTPLETGQRVEIVTSKQGGPSRDWLNPALGFITTKSARNKVRQWFGALAVEETLAEGRAIIARELQRLGETRANIDDLAQKLGYGKGDDLYLAAGRGELQLRQMQTLLRGEPEAEHEPPALVAKKSKVADGGGEGILIVGVDKLMTQLARCCKPAPPDPIAGFVTRGKGVSIHRADCTSFAHVAALHPERVIETSWGSQTAGIFSVDIVVEAHDRQGLLRDISEVLAREKINVTAVNTQSKQERANMCFTVEVADLPQLQRVLGQLHEVDGVFGVRRG